MDCYLKEKCKLYKAGKCKQENSLFCQYKDRSDRLFEAANIPENKRYKQALVNDRTSEPEKDPIIIVQNTVSSEKNVMAFINNGVNFLFWSTTPGNGKTSSALQICRAYIDCIWNTAEVGSCRVLFINIPRYLAELKHVIAGGKSEYAEHIKDNVLTADLVVWDDIAMKMATEFEMDTLFSAIDTRLYTGKANIFTSNTPPAELVRLIGARLASRIIGESYKFEFVGPDKRTTRGTDNNGTITGA